MRILIVAYIKGSFPFIPELVEQLKLKNIDVIQIDLFEMYSILDVRDKPEVIHHIKNVHLRYFFKIPLLKNALRYVFYNFYYLGKLPEFDHVSIHSAKSYYIKFLKKFKTISKSMSVCIWGSDFYRITTKERIRLYPIFNYSDSIVIGNPEMALDFGSFYDNKYRNKLRICGFGIGKLNLISNLEINFTKEELKLKIGLPLYKVILTIGYNGSTAQQHLLVLKEIKALSRDILDSIVLVIPFGYGGSSVYKQEIVSFLDNLSVDYVIFDEFLSDEKVASLRICSDIVVNCQISDAASASLQEHLYAKNVLLVGEWLPYEYFSDRNVSFWTFNSGNLRKNIEKMLLDLEFYKNKAVDNKNRIDELSNWRFRIDEWISVFNNEFANRN
jgi:hypothetical protein